METEQREGRQKCPRIFHYSEGASHKFWSITVEARVQTVQWGRIGSGGQTRSKEFATEAEARDVSLRLIQAKLKKGYVEVSPDAARQATARKRVRFPKRTCQQLLLPF